MTQHTIEAMIDGLEAELEKYPDEHDRRRLSLLESIENLKKGETPAKVPDGLEWLILPGEVTEEGVLRSFNEARRRWLESGERG